MNNDYTVRYHSRYMPSELDQSTLATLDYESKLSRSLWEKPAFRILIAVLLWLAAAAIGGFIGALI